MEKYHEVKKSELQKKILGWIADAFQANSKYLVLVWLDENSINKNQFEVEMRLDWLVVRVRFQEKVWNETERDDTMEFRLNPNRKPGMITRSSKQIIVHCGGNQPIYNGLPNNIWFEACQSELVCSLRDFLKEKITGQEWNI